MHVGIFICRFIFMHACVYVCEHMCMHAGLCVRMIACMRACIKNDLINGDSTKWISYIFTFSLHIPL